MFPGRTIVERIRKQYPVDSRVELVRMDDAQAPPVGTRGTVTGVDDIGSIMVNWDNGSGLNVAWGEDIVRKLDSVVVITYGQKQIWDSRDEAARFFFKGMMECEGAERDRYAKIYADLILGLPVCTDEEDD